MLLWRCPQTLTFLYTFSTLKPPPHTNRQGFGTWHITCAVSFLRLWGYKTLTAILARSLCCSLYLAESWLKEDSSLADSLVEKNWSWQIYNFQSMQIEWVSITLEINVETTITGIFMETSCNHTKHDKLLSQCHVGWNHQHLMILPKGFWSNQEFGELANSYQSGSSHSSKCKI
jgi:hypothetical protein